MKRFWGFIIVFAAGTGFFFALMFWQYQNRMMQVWIPIKIQVLSTNVERHSGKSTTYTPQVTYTYTYKGQNHQSDRVTMTNESASLSWAWSVVDRYSGDNPDPAYIDPDNPEDSILVHQYTVYPLVIVAITAIGIEVGFAMIIGLVGGTRKTMTAIPMTEGWQLLLPDLSLRSAFWRAFWRWAGFSVAAIPLLAHFVMVARPLLFSFYVVSVICAAVWLTLTYILYRCWSVSRHVSDARLQVRPVPLVLGKPFGLRVEFDANSTLKVEGLTAQVVCVEHYKEKRGNKTTMGIRTHSERTADILAGSVAEFRSGDVVGGERVVETEPNWPASHAGRKSYPYFTWEVRVKLKLAGMVDYAGVFPLTATQGEQTD